MTVGELRQHLLGLRDDLHVLFRVQVVACDGDDQWMGEVASVGVEAGCTETEVLMLDGYADLEDEDDDLPPEPDRNDGTP